MKDYTQNEKDRKYFIIEYIKDDNKIIVSYANNTKKEYIYSLEKELEILNKMEKQVNNYDNIKKYLNNNIKNSSLWLVILILIVVSNIYMLVNSLTDVVSWIFLSLMSISIYINITNLKEYIATLNDLEKTKFYLENRDDFLKESKVSNDIEKVNINNISKYTLTELKEYRNILTDNVDNREKKVKKLTLKK